MESPCVIKSYVEKPGGMGTAALSPPSVLLAELLLLADNLLVAQRVVFEALIISVHGRIATH